MKKVLFYLLCILCINEQAFSQNFTSGESYTYTKVYLDSVKSTIPNQNAQSIQTVQYKDGLGRIKQDIAINAIKPGQDIVTSYFYGINGEVAKQYLPITKGSQNGLLHNISEGEINAYHNTSNAFSEVKYDGSPFNRITEQASVGDGWGMNGNHTSSIKYSFNQAGSVKKYVALLNGRTLVNTLYDYGFYDANTLYKVTTKDEDGNIAELYKNGSGKTILSRIKKGAENIDTYYVYNQVEQLTHIIPPLNAGENPLSESAKNEILYHYNYDAIGRLTEKKVPGRGTEYYVYDRENRVVMSTDSRLLAQGKWTFIKYDRFGRIAYTGMCTGANRKTEQQNADNSSVLYELKTSAIGFQNSSMDVYYTKNAYPIAITDIFSINYYDAYPQGMPIAKPANIYSQPTLPSDVIQNHSTKSLLTATYVKNVEAAEWEKNYFWYDTKERLIGNHKTTHQAGYSKTEMKLDFPGNITESKVYHKRLQNDNELVIKQRYVYSAQNLLVKHYHKVDNQAEVLLNEISYDDLGRIVNKKVGDNLQSVDYTYNVKGWLTSINNPDDLGNDLFALKINYNQITPTAANTAKARYNGNISQVFWKTANSKEVRSYDYIYDELNRLTAANYSRGNAIKFAYDERISYDNRGNITTLTRNGQSERNNGLLLDELTYYYQQNSNKLNNVDDSRPQIGFTNLNTTTGISSGKENDYFYDENGNMTQDLNQGITEIKYNYLNLPTEVIWNSTKKITYSYNAAGVKLKKVSVDGSKTTTVEYLDGFQYQNTKLQFIPTAEGYVNVMGNIVNQQRAYNYVYNYKDHLGNVRVSYAWDDKESKLKILEDNHFYPFGGKHRGYSGLNYTPSPIGEIGGVTINPGGDFGDVSSKYSGKDNYHYKYNSKELQIESGFYDYGWRQYMPDIGRWNGIDQLAESYHNINPYAYVGNNPISFTDPDGRKITPTGDGYSFSGADLDVLIAFITGGGNVRNLSQQLSSYESNGGDFGSGPLSNFWGGFDSGGAIMGIEYNSNTGYVSWMVHDGNGSYSENGTVILEGFTIHAKKETTTDAFEIVFKDNDKRNSDIMGTILGSLGLANDLGSYGWDNLSNKKQWRYSYKTHKFLKSKGYNYKTNVVKKSIPKGFKGTGVALGVISSGMIVYDVVDKKEIKASHLLDGTITAVSFVPGWGWIVGGVYFGADIITQIVTDKSIGDHLDEAINNNGTLYKF
ncbi:RHS repeat-associated core domain-containing protein [Empedobacter brevis]|uniref:DUF6443 domain-containing protein n=1 Tax=Empedobacter brevis TaxID=247 RepID=UPI00123D6247|nr:DUF6443 domain-containing protein [Empedobacter brevis]QES92871.1 RHS repeat-associated core domain-containing protein [Empedobacter brevis]